MEAFIDLVDVLRHEFRELEAEQQELRRAGDQARAIDLLDREIEEHVIEIIALGGDPDERSVGEV